jgi:hypothetical protein
MLNQILNDFIKYLFNFIERDYVITNLYSGVLFAYNNK